MRDMAADPAQTNRGGRGFPAAARLALVVVGLALLPRLGYYLQLRDSPFFLHPVIDAATYHGQALEVAQGRPLADEVFWQPPLYPYMLGLFYRLAGPRIDAARLVQLLIGAGACALTAIVSRRLFGSLAGWTAGLLVAACGPLIFFEAELLSPVLSIALNVLGLVLLTPRREDGRSPDALPLGRWLLAGAVLGLSIISRPDVLPFVVLVGLGAIFSAARPRRRLFPRLLLWAVAVAVPLLPVVAHNVLRGGEWVPVSSNLGINLYLGNSTAYDRTVGIRPGFEWRRLVLEPLRAGIPPEEAAATSRWWVRRTWAAVRGNPGGWLRDLTKKAVLLVGAAEAGRNLDLKFCRRFTPLLGWLPGWGVVFPLAVAGMVLARRQKPSLLLMAYLGGYAVSGLVFFVAGRYRLPMVPVLAIFGGYAVDRAWFWLRGRSWRRLAALVLAVVAVAGVIRIDVYGAAEVDEADGQYFLGVVLSAAGDADGAARAYQRAIALDASSWDALFNLAAIAVELGRPELAASLYARLLERFPDDTESLMNLALLRTRLGRREEALALFRQAAESPAASSQMLATLSRTYLAMGRLDQARRSFERAREHGLRGVGRAVLAGHLAAQERARFLLERLLAAELPPAQGPDEETRRRLAEVGKLFVSGRPADAERLLAETLTAAPGCAAGWEKVGKLWYLLGRREAAISAFERAVALDSQCSDAYLGLAHALADDPATAAAAVAALRTLLERDPEGPHADKARRALSALGAGRSATGTASAVDRPL